MPKPSIYARRRPSLATLVGSLVFVFWGGASLSAADTAATDFFEQNIRPLLTDKCYDCHNAANGKTKGGLSLDSKEGWQKGGEAGQVIIPGDPEKSRLIKAVRYLDEDLQMPPKGKKLKPEQVALLEQWVRMGAPDPRTKAATVAGSAISRQATNHWAFKPIVAPPIPAVHNKRWVQSPMDAFVLAKLEAANLKPSRKADKRTLIRRASFDLTGLPPTPKEVASFEKDSSPDAYEKLIDRLLQSPQYGERWGRYWLDVARYADSKGYVFEEERKYAYSYTYRDYVVRAFNDDLPFDRFVTEQLAADSLELGQDKRPLAALGYLTLGRRFLNNTPDIIDDRIDVVARGLMGLTVSCARCHDHKFDPIPTKDYYSLYGVFDSSYEPGEKPLISTASESKEYKGYLKEKQSREDERNNFKLEKENLAVQSLFDHLPDYLLTAGEKLGEKEDATIEARARQRKLDPNFTRIWRTKLQKWTAEKWGAPLAGKFSEARFDFLKPNGKETNTAFNAYALLFASMLTNRVGTLTNQSALLARLQSSLSTNELADIRTKLSATDVPLLARGDQLHRMFDVPSAQKLRALQRKLDELDATHPGAPARAMVLLDQTTPHDTHVFKRGNPGTPGDKVPRHFVSFLSGNDPKPFSKGSGRLELAQSIVSKENPLTARVLVNRIWMNHFGTPLVKTPSDFGLRSDPPTNPELLDALAAQFMREGWSLKRLHKSMMLSSTYQQTSDDDARSRVKDPGNQLYWRMNRRRLDFESMRDSLLYSSGRLDLTQGGRAVDLTTEPYSTRRTLYGFVERQNMPGLFRTFDFPNPDFSSAQRFQTTVPQQALFMLNSPFVVEQVRNLVNRPELTTQNPEAKVSSLYRVLFQREPSRGELRTAMDFLQTKPEGPAPFTERSPWSYGYGKIQTNPAPVVTFTPLTNYTGSAWQGGASLPDKATGWVMLNNTGGHPGDTNHAAIRRWTAPTAGTISIAGSVAHSSDAEDGIQASIVHSRLGILKTIGLKNQKETIELKTVEVQAGDTLDFIAHCGKTETSDSFTWAPRVHFEKVTVASYEGRKDWNAKTDFAGVEKPGPRPLNSLEELAQALLVSNEAFFFD